MDIDKPRSFTLKINLEPRSVVDPTHTEEHCPPPSSGISVCNAFEAFLNLAGSVGSVYNDKINCRARVGNVPATVMNGFAYPDIVPTGLHL
jgi:hypothetical protein